MLADREAKQTMVVIVAIGEKIDNDEIQAILTDEEALTFTQHSDSDMEPTSPKTKQTKLLGREQQNSTRSNDMTHRSAFNKLYFNEDSPFQYTFSKEMEGIILKHMETNSGFALDVKLAVHEKNYDNLDFSKIIDADLSMQQHGIKFDINKTYATVTIGGVSQPPTLIEKKHGNNKNNQTEVFDSLTETTAALKNAIGGLKKNNGPTNITFVREKGRRKIVCSLLASDISKCKNGKDLLISCNNGFKDKTHTLRFDWEGLNCTKFRNQFCKLPLSDILMGRNITVKIRVSVYEYPRDDVSELEGDGQGRIEMD